MMFFTAFCYSRFPWSNNAALRIIIKNCWLYLFPFLKTYDKILTNNSFLYEKVIHLLGTWFIFGFNDVFG